MKIDAMVWLYLLAVINIFMAGSGYFFVDQLLSKKYYYRGVTLPTKANMVFYIIQIIAAFHCFIYLLFQKTVIKAENLPYLNFISIPIAIWWVFYSIFSRVVPVEVVLLAVALFGYFVNLNIVTYVETGYCCFSEEAPSQSGVQSVPSKNFFMWHELLVELGKRMRSFHELNVIGLVCGVFCVLVPATRCYIDYRDRPFQIYCFSAVILAFSCFELKAFIGHRKNAFYYTMATLSLHYFTIAGLLAYAYTFDDKYYIFISKKAIFEYLAFGCACTMAAVIHNLFYQKLKKADNVATV
ncbi:unnamed protein product [Bursaphelenchus okinawaensis]|uniref:Uncharacterized protein n=1 Tax=Bursaphelenchus okinawaensis TaxID=465554 RepID=A0A811KLT0_9BILA|nr:unnamed protein product [Bursaphelenchus okinawaensis]CAG9107233.1 unnamed protein product [Bursaphelenchus okinawaensis]